MICNLVTSFFMKTMYENGKAPKLTDEFEYKWDYSSKQTYEESKKQYSCITKSAPMDSALAQCTGEAAFLSRMQLRQNCLFCYPIFAGIPKGKFKFNFTLQ